MLNPVFKVTGKIDERIRNAIISLCCIFLTGFFAAYYEADNSFGLYLDHTRNNMICGCVLIILVICSIREPLKKVKWNPVLFYLFFLGGFGIVAISFLHPIGSGYRSFGLMMMVGFPCLYYVWNNRGDYDTLYKRLAWATCLVGLLTFAYSVYLAANGKLLFIDGRVNAFFRNQNMFSMTGMVMVCAALYLFIANRNSLPWFLFSTVSFATGWEIVLLGVSRLSILVCAGSIVALIIFGIKTHRNIIEEPGHPGIVLKTVIIIATTIAVIAAGSYLFIADNGIDANKAAADNSAQEDQAVEDEQLTATDRFDTSGVDMDTYTAGRISIWRGYSQTLNMWGNTFDKEKIHEVTGSYVVHAHNNFLEYAYRCGVPVACIHILLELYAGIICIIFLFDKKYKEPYHLFAIIFMICYALESMLDIATLPFERQAPFFFYMALIAVFGKNTEAVEVPDNYETPRHMRKE